MQNLASLHRSTAERSLSGHGRLGGAKCQALLEALRALALTRPWPALASLLRLGPPEVLAVAKTAGLPKQLSQSPGDFHEPRPGGSHARSSSGRST